MADLRLLKNYMGSYYGHVPFNGKWYTFEINTGRLMRFNKTNYWVTSPELIKKFESGSGILVHLTKNAEERLQEGLDLLLLEGI